MLDFILAYFYGCQTKNKKNLEPGNLGFKTFCIAEHLIKYNDVYL